MPLCDGCGASYENSFKFCPHCGRAKTEPQKIIVEHVIQESDRLSRKDVIAILSGNGVYKQKLVSKNWVGDETYAPVFRANLAGVDLSGLDLSGLNLSGVNFKGANFEEANLSGANMRNALVSCANLKRAIIREANLSDTNFIESVLIGADLSQSELSGTIFNGANLTSANLSDTYFVDTRPRFGNALVEQVQISQVRNMSKNWLNKIFG
jgi:uncharacterized protein YjbI with pentapeptide repeats